MKKLLLLLGAVALLVLLTACSNYQPQESEPAATTTQIPQFTTIETTTTQVTTWPVANPTAEPANVQLYFERATDELLATFGQVHEIVVNADEAGASILFWADTPITNVTRISLNIDNWDAEWAAEGTGFRPVLLAHMAVVEQVLPGQAVVFHGHQEGGTFPVAGVAFEDENGAQRFFAFMDRRGYLDEQWIFFEIFEDRNVF